MTVRTRAQLISDANQYLPNNRTGDISPADVRQRIIDLAESAVMGADIPLIIDELDLPSREDVEALSSRAESLEGKAEELDERITSVSSLSIAPGPVTLVPYGEPPTISITGEAPNYELGLGLPEGPGGTDAVARADILTLAGRAEGLERRVPVTRSLMGITPLLIAAGRVVGWLTDTGVKFQGLDGTNMASVQAYAEPRRSPRASSLPIMTDGRSLHRWRGAIAKLKAGVAGVKPRVVLTGDSWMELNPLPVALRDRIALDYTMAGWGWWYAIPGSRFSNPGAGYVRSANWTFVDASAGAALSYGTGPDGNLATTTLDTETLTFNNLTTTGIKIYTREWGGAWRYRVDGGSWTTVSEANTDGRLKITTISGLLDASHVIDIDTTGNTGRVAFAGFMIAGADTGVEVLRMGNGASRGIHLTAWSPFIADIGADIAPDLVVVSLGTNDYRYGDGVAAYIQGLRDLRDGWRAAVPSIGFVFMAPPLSGGTVVTPQSQFRDALYEFCLTEGHEFFNGTDDWPAYAVSNAQGLWDDSLHPNVAGSNVLVNRLYRNMLGL